MPEHYIHSLLFNESHPEGEVRGLFAAIAEELKLGVASGSCHSERFVVFVCINRFIRLESQPSESLVLYSALKDFSPGTPVFPSPQKPTFDKI